MCVPARPTKKLAPIAVLRSSLRGASSAELTRAQMLMFAIGIICAFLRAWTPLIATDAPLAPLVGLLAAISFFASAMVYKYLVRLTF